MLSLSGVADSLYQWRAYASSGGVAIGFDYEKLQKGFLCDITQKAGGRSVTNPIRPDPSNQLMRCQYTDNNGHLDLRSIVAERFFRPDSYATMYASQQPVIHELFCASLSATIYRTICSIKHGAYKSEDEWRCVNYRPDRNDYPVKISETNRLYIEMEFDPKVFIKEVWQGCREWSSFGASFLLCRSSAIWIAPAARKC